MWKLLTSVLDSFLWDLSHLAGNFRRFWSVHRGFQLLNGPKSSKIASQYATTPRKANPKLRLLLLFLGCLLCSGCSKYYLSVQQQWIDVSYLASAQINTPDPRKSNPPVGQKLIIDWRVPRSLLRQQPQLVLDLIFWDYTTKTIYLPIKGQMNYTTYELLNAEYEKTGGILTYKASIVDAEGKMFRESKHQLWVNLIQIEE